MEHSKNRIETGCAGCPKWVTNDKTHPEHKESALHSFADIEADMRFRR